MTMFTSLIVIKLKGAGLVIGLLFHTVITNGYNMKSMENSGKKKFSIVLNCVDGILLIISLFLADFLSFLTRETTFVTSSLLSQGEQIHSLLSRSLFRRREKNLNRVIFPGSVPILLQL